MLNALPLCEPDPIIKLMQVFQADTRADKIDLGVGVYRDATGHTPIFRAVKVAEELILATQDTKAYLGLGGDPAFTAATRDLVFGGSVEAERIAAVATPGGSSALRQLLDLARLAAPMGRVWISEPTWPNHPGIGEAIGMPVWRYGYYDRATGQVAFEAMLADLAGTGPGDVVILHAACHNPTGADLDLDQWEALSDVLAQTGAMPLVDAAYLGFGEGVIADTEGLRILAERLPQMMVALSGSKSFGMYRERVAAAFVVGETPKLAETAQAALISLNRLNFAFPPDHGARVATEILTDAELRADWESELGDMRKRIAGNRTKLADALEKALGDDRFGYLAEQRGMFSVLGFDDDMLTRLRETHGLYLVADGRINAAGLTDANIPLVAAAIAAEL